MLSIPNISSIIDEKYIEHDSYFIFSLIMKATHMWFTSNNKKFFEKKKKKKKKKKRSQEILIIQEKKWI